MGKREREEFARVDFRSIGKTEQLSEELCDRFADRFEAVVVDGVNVSDELRLDAREPFPVWPIMAAAREVVEQEFLEFAKLVVPNADDAVSLSRVAGTMAARIAAACVGHC